jgi:2-(1,2-epoxy-1,2-dihydrophenyl)acetyl-CoA isomerase
MANRARPTQAYELATHDGVAILRLVTPIYDLAHDLAAKESVLAAIAALELDEATRVLLVLAPADGFDPDAYAQFLNQGPGTLASASATSSRLDIEYSREENALAQFIVALHRLPRLTITCLRGRVAAPFVGTCLASDFRLAGADTELHLNHLALGVPPGGGLGFFLPRYVGCGRALELLVQETPLTATTARQLGLITQVLPVADFEAQCVAWATRLARAPLVALQGLKTLCQAYPEAELNAYLQTETKTMRQAMLTHWAGARAPADSAG